MSSKHHLIYEMLTENLTVDAPLPKAMYAAQLSIHFLCELRGEDYFDVVFEYSGLPCILRVLAENRPFTDVQRLLAESLLNFIIAMKLVSEEEMRAANVFVAVQSFLQNQQNTEEMVSYLCNELYQGFENYSEICAGLAYATRHDEWSTLVLSCGLTSSEAILTVKGSQLSGLLDHFANIDRSNPEYIKYKKILERLLIGGYIEP